MGSADWPPWTPSELQQPAGTHHQVLLLAHPGQIPHAAQNTVGANPELKRIGQIDEPKHGLQFVVTVGPAAHDAQHQVELGGGRPRQPKSVGHCLKRSITWRISSLSGSITHTVTRPSG